MLLIPCFALAEKPQSPDADQRLTPTTYRSHFEANPGASPGSGSRDGWESYPIAQEAGYDPTMCVETAAGISAVVREAAPLQDGFFQLGFVRRLHMVTGPNASIHLRVKVPYASGSTTLHIFLYRGEDEEKHDVQVSGNEWQEIVLPLAAKAAPLSAIAIAADFPNAVKGRSERLLMSDVRIHALATRRIDLLAPQALWDPTRELYYLQRALHPGDNLTVTSEQCVTDCHWALTAPDGQVAEQGTGFQIRHHFSFAAQPGIYSLNIHSVHAITNSLLLLKPAQPYGIFFDQPPVISSELLQSIRDRRAVLEKTAHAEMGSNIAVMDADWLLPGLPSYFTILLESPELAMLDAIEFRATGDLAALARSLALLRTIATWPEWVHPWFPAHGYHSYYPVGIMTKYVVLAMEFLGSDLPGTDRRSLNDRLMELAIKPIYEEYVQEDRLQFNTSNWIGNTAGGALLAALASDSPDAAGYALGLYTKERDHVRAAYTADGSYGEGVSYQRFDLEMTSLVAAASKQLLGQSIDSLMEDGERYLQYAAYSPNGILDFGDSHVDLRPSNVFAYQAALNKSDGLADFYFKYRDTGTAQIISRVLFESSIKPPASPPASLPPSRVFDHRGIAVLRDSWTPDASVIAMRAGPNFNHNHADEGSLFFVRNGKVWLGEAGYADYYKDPSYQTFNIQAIGHNTLLVDNNPESQVIPGNTVFGAYPHIIHSLIGESASLVQADLTAAYGSALQHYTRTLFFKVGGPLIVIDDVSAATPHAYTLAWHPKQDIVSYSAGSQSFRLSDGDASLDLQTFSSIPLKGSEQPTPLPLVDYERSEHALIHPPVHFEFSTTTPSSMATLITIIETQGVAQQAEPPVTWKVNSNIARLHCKGLDVQIIKPNEDHSEGRESEILIHWEQGAFMLNGTQFKDPDSARAISSNRPIDMQLTRLENSLARVEVDAKAPTDLTISGMSEVRQSPCSLESNCNSSTRGLISVPAGRSSFTFRDSEVTIK